MPKKIETKKLPKVPAVTAGKDMSWDLTEVDSTYLVAELIRRGAWVPEQTKKGATGGKRR